MSQGRSYATTSVSSSGSRKLSLKACRTLLGLCIDAIYAMFETMAKSLGSLDVQESDEA